jgi:hypothetical protein
VKAAQRQATAFFVCSPTIFDKSLQGHSIHGLTVNKDVLIEHHSLTKKWTGIIQTIENIFPSNLAAERSRAFQNCAFQRSN